MSKNSKSDKQHRELFQNILWIGPALFLENLVPQDRLPEYENFDRDNAKSFLLLKLLTEVQQAGFVFERWNSFLDNKTIENENSKSQIIQSFINEQSLWQRKLLEGLVLLINFTKSNELDYFYHFLLLHELQHFLNLKNEQKHFFQHENELTVKTIELLISKIERIEISIGNLSTCWYLNSIKKERDKRGRVFASFGNQLKKALEISTSREKTALGYTYATTYGEASNNIHFSVKKIDYDNLHERFKMGIAQCGLIGTAILRRAHELTEVQPRGINKHLQQTEKKLAKNKNPLVKNLAVGDFVLADGPYLGEIKNKARSKFGYESYKIKYLHDTPIEDIKDSWFPSLHVQLFLKREDLLIGLNNRLEHEKEKGNGPSPPFTDSEIQEALYESVIMVWEMGINPYLQNNFKQTSESKYRRLFLANLKGI